MRPELKIDVVRLERHQPGMRVIRQLAEHDSAIDVVEIDANEIEIPAQSLREHEHRLDVRRPDGLLRKIVEVRGAQADPRNCSTDMARWCQHGRE